MKGLTQASSEFASLVEQLIKNPDNPILKLALIRQLPQMKALAEIEPLSLFRLAQLYIPTSSQYKTMMTESAERGCTNAMLAVCELLLKSNRQENMQQVDHYLQKIDASNDSYIIEKSRKLLAQYSHGFVVNTPEVNVAAGLKSMGFFKAPVNNESDNELSLQAKKGPSAG